MTVPFPDDLVIDRRTFVSAATGILMAASLRSYAQARARVYRVGLLEPIPAGSNVANVEALRQGLRSLGYVEGRNLVILYRSADGEAERFAALASELVLLRVDVLVSRGTPAAMAAKSATATIPIVMAAMGEPRDLVASFARPGANVTGVTTFSTELMAKRVEILKELVPKLARVGLLHNMSNPAAPPEWEEMKVASRALGIECELIDVRSASDLRRGFDQAGAARLDGLVVGADGLMQKEQRLIVDLAAAKRLVLTYPSREHVDAGGLVSYAVNYPDLYRQLATVVDKVLKGKSPAEIPVERPTKFELVINVRTAAALGVTIPQSLALRADDLVH